VRVTRAIISPRLPRQLLISVKTVKSLRMLHITNPFYLILPTQLKARVSSADSSLVAVS